MSIEIRYKIYALIDPRDSIVRYIGLTMRPIELRLQQHLRNTEGGLEKFQWINELKHIDNIPIIQVIEEDLTFEEAHERETYWIQQYFNAKSPLTNITKLVKPKRLQQLEANSGFYRGNEQVTNEIWITMTEAAQEMKVSISKLCRLAGKGTIKTELDPLDERVKLVELNQLKQLLGSSKRVKRQS